MENTEDKEYEIDSSHEEEGYVIADNEIYYIDNKYIRKDIMDNILLDIQSRYNENSEIDEIRDDIIEAHLQNIELYHSVNTILNEIRDDEDYKSIIEYIDNEEIEDYDIENILKDSVNFSLTKPSSWYEFIDLENDNDKNVLEHWSYIELESILDDNLKNEEDRKVYAINIYDSYYEELKEEFLTEKEINYLAEKIESIISTDVIDELRVYKEKGNCRKEIYFDVPYTVYQTINFITFKEKFLEQYPDADIGSRKKRIRGLIKPKEISSYPSRKIYNDIKDFNINNNAIKKIITYLYNRDKDLNKKYNYRELNPLSKNIPLLKSGMIHPIKDNKTVVQLFPNGFTISDLLEIDSTLERNTISDKSIFRFLKNSDLIVEFTKWNSPLQRVYTRIDNHVFQLNIRTLQKEDEVFNYAEELYRENLREDATWNIKKKVKKWQRTTGHPVSRKKITLAWIRFTKINEDEVIMDEIQTDLDDEDQYFGRELMDGWEDIILSKFIKFVKYNLHINKIYYPTYTTKKNKYKANPPTYLYSNLPKKYGFSSENSDLEGFMLLEKKIKGY